MVGHSRSKNGVASARYAPAIHIFVCRSLKDVDARHKAGHDVMGDSSNCPLSGGPYSAGFSAGGDVAAAPAALAFFSTMPTAMIEPS